MAPESPKAGKRPDRSPRSSGEASPSALRQLLDATTDGYFQANLSNGIVTVSPRWSEIAGRSPHVGTIPLEEWESLRHPDDVTSGLPGLRVLMDGSTDRIDMTCRLRQGDGSHRWVRTRAKVVAKSGSGKPLRLAGAVIDIHAQKIAEDALRVSEQMLRAVVENSLEGINVVDLATGRYSFLSPAQMAMTGFTDEELRDMGIEQALARVHPEDRHIPSELFRAIAGGAPEGKNVEYRWKVKSGEYRWFSDSRKAIRDEQGRPVAVVGVTFDVTDRRRADAALREREALFRSVFDSPLVGIAITSPQKGWMEVNDAIVRMLGYTAEELSGTSWAELTHPDDLTADLGEFERVLSGERTGYSLEKRFLRKDGSVLWASMSVSGVRGPDGRVEYFVALLTDISTHRMAQEQLQVSSRLAALGTLVAGVAHEINNPLAGCTASLGLAIEDLRDLREQAAGGRLDDREATARRLAESLEVLGEASAGAQRIARIVKDLTIFGRPDPRRIRIQLIDAVDEAMRWLPAAVATTATVQVENEGAADVIGSVGQLGQVVVNLVTNAARSIPDGRRGRITVRVGEGNRGMSRLEVVDNGAGIPSDVMKRIFDPFFTTRKVGQGMGLGLPVCHAIVTAHGGSIAVRSHPGAGSCFTIELPAAPRPA